MHWAAHKHTAAEVVFYRADAEKENMGLTSWEGKQIKKKQEDSLSLVEEHFIESINRLEQISTKK